MRFFYQFQGKTNVSFTWDIIDILMSYETVTAVSVSHGCDPFDINVCPSIITVELAIARSE